MNRTNPSAASIQASVLLRIEISRARAELAARKAIFAVDNSEEARLEVIGARAYLESLESELPKPKDNKR